MLFTVDIHKDFIDLEGIAVATVFTLQSSRVNGSEFDAPQSDRFSTDGDATLRQQILNIPVA
jgi:hypothetical protein